MSIEAKIMAAAANVRMSLSEFDDSFTKFVESVCEKTGMDRYRKHNMFLR